MRLSAPFVWIRRHRRLAKFLKGLEGIRVLQLYLFFLFVCELNFLQADRLVYLARQLGQFFLLIIKSRRHRFLEL